MFTGLLDGLISKIDHVLQKLETRLGLVLASLIVSLVLLFIASIYCAPALELINHGKDYGTVSLDPFETENGNRFQNRILTPFIGYILFLKGPLFIVLPLLMALAFISTLYFHFRKLDVAPGTAIGLCCLIVLSSPILFTLHFAGYVDTTSYLLLFLCYLFRNRPLWVFVYFSLALCNHESNAIAIPWIIMISGYGIKAPVSSYFKMTLAVVLALVPFLIVRHLTSDSATIVQFDWFLNKSNIADSIWLQRNNLIYGIFQAFKLFWCFPIVATVLALMKKEYFNAALITLIIACSGLQLLIASDTSRLLGLAFPAIVIAALEIRRHMAKIQFRRLLWSLIILNAIVPQAFVGYGVIVPFHSLPMALYLKFYAGIDIWETIWT